MAEGFGPEGFGPEGFSPGFNFGSSDTSYYKQLGLNQNASKKDILKRFRNLAKLYHPDKTRDSSTEDAMKELNKMKSVLLDEVERRKYDEELATKSDEPPVPLFMRKDRGDILLPPAARHSKEFLLLFYQSKRKFQHLPKPNFEDNIKKFDQELLNISGSVPASKQPSQVTLRKKPLRSLYKEVSSAANRSSTVDFDFCDYETIKLILKRIQKNSPSSLTAQSAGDCVPIINVDGASKSDLIQLLYLFSPDVSESPGKVDLQKQLKKCIPSVTIQNPPVPKYTITECVSCGSKPKWFKRSFGICYWCSRPFCNNCPLQQCHYPRLGSALHKLCSGCIEDISRAEADDWAEFSIRVLAKCDDESIMVSLGCASVAMALGSNPHDLLTKLAKKLQSNNKHELAYSIISLEISESEGSSTPKQQMKAHRLASLILLSMAKIQTKSLDEKWNFALASKEAYLTAVSLNIELEQNVEFTDNQMNEVDKILQDLLEEKDRQKELSILQHIMSFETLWMQRDVYGILKYWKDQKSGYNSSNSLQEDIMLQAIQSFLKNKEPYISKMLPEDKHALCFVKGVVKMTEKNMKSAFEDIEAVAWSHSTSSVPEDAILGAAIHATTDKDTHFYSFKDFKKIISDGSRLLLFSSSPQNSQDCEHSSTLLFPSDSELTPPFESNWPSLSVVGHNSMCHKKYEDAVLKLYNEGKWSRLQVAWAYLDEFPGCEHPAEMVVCYLHAAMWIVSILQPASRIEANKLYGLKCIVMRLIQVAYAISFKALNPGMELYVIRLSIGMIRKIAQMPDSKFVLSDDDFDFLVILIKRLEKVSRLFPFWNPPSVSVSEAVMFNIFSRKLHSVFILGLQDVDKERCPLTSVDLKYQLYENDFRCLLPMESPLDCRARAMGELLKCMSWSWNDVIDTMSSKLTLRDRDGWIIQSSKLGIPQQYSEIVGFVIDVDPDHPSIELLLVEADKRQRKVGLFSQEDINVMLRLEHSDFPLYFSLDPPTDDLDKQYHPFQQWRYATEKVKDTEVLNTMFITDYMMKSFTVGSDVSTTPPFHQRPTRDGLLKNLPQHLQHALRSIHERGGFLSNSFHRFWIEAKEMKYDCQQEGSKIKFYFDEMKMIVKSHSLRRKLDGELDDTDEDDDPNSPEKQFAKDMTNHYDELSTYFPQFARLRQLSKLHMFAIFLDSALQSLKDSAEEKNIELPNELVKKIQEDARQEHRTNVTKALTDLKHEVGTWPKADDRYYVNSKVREIESEMRRRMQEEEDRLHRIHGYNVIIDNSDALRALRNVEYEVLEAIRRNDEEILDQITRALRDATKMQQDRNLKQYVRSWLSATPSRFSFKSSTPQEDLVKYVCQHLPIPSRQEIYQQLVDYHKRKYNTLQSLCSKYKSKGFHAPNTCRWVPAAVCSEGSSISYGGVAFTTKATPVRDGQRIHVSGKARYVQIQKIQVTVGPRSNSKYTTPSGISYDKVSRGQTSARTESMRKNLNTISKRVTAREQSVNPSHFRNANSTSLNTQFDKFILGTETSSSTPPRAVSAGGSGGKPPRGGGPPKGPPSDGSTWKPGLPSSGTNGIYKLIDKKTGKVYIGRSCDIPRRVSEHKRDVRKGTKTVGKHFSSPENVEVYYIELPKNLDRPTMQVHEQKKLNDARKKHGEKVINVRNAMSPKRFEQITHSHSVAAAAKKHIPKQR